ncbi:MAG TPA: TIGR00730 family Rossman fold protein [Gammaproteobacteria bacterium]|nr:TIGR00730 family Rossman fold protein [Gammaproteobacteria bacterium]
MRICVFAGSRVGSEAYRQAACALGRELAERSIGVVFGGGRIGLMGALADAALAAGGEVIGVIPDFLCHSEIPHESLSRLHVTRSMHERKQLMADCSDAFIVLPGGIGTLEETFEAWTWLQLGIHAKPIGLFNVGGFFDSLERFLDELVERGFVGPRHRALLQSSHDARELIDLLAQSAPESGTTTERMDRT